MKVITVPIPDRAHKEAESLAKMSGLDVGALCGTILADHFLNGPSFGPRRSAKSPQLKRTTANGTRQSGSAGIHLDVAMIFSGKGYPADSIRFAQAVVDEALKLPGVSAREHNRGIAFQPNFLWIEYLRSQGGKIGIKVSLYGSPSRFVGAPKSLGAGRGTYSRTLIETDEQLRQFLPLVRQAYEFRCGPVAGPQP